jgi:hypothetical protein
MRPPKLPAIRASFRTHHVVTLGERDFKRRSTRAGLGWSTQRQFDNAAKQASPFARKLFDLRLRRLYLSADRGQLTPRAVTGCRSQWRASEHKYDNLRIRIAKILLSHQWIWSSDGGDHAPPRCIFQLAAPHARVRLRASDLVSLGGHHVVTMWSPRPLRSTRGLMSRRISVALSIVYMVSAVGIEPTTL